MSTLELPPLQTQHAAVRQRDNGGEEPFEVQMARTLEEATEAWQLLYMVYRRAGYIDENPFEIHTVPQAIGPHALVVMARQDGVPISTISAIGDGPLGLPLDTVYAEELRQWRKPGRYLLEIGLLGDWRDSTENASSPVFELMRWAFHFGLAQGVTDYLCGIPPRRARLYTRLFGFQAVGELRSYSTVKDAPVVLMHADTEWSVKNCAILRAINYFMKNPLPPSTFEDRCRFDPTEMADSPIGRFLAMKSLGQDGSARASAA